MINSLPKLKGCGVKKEKFIIKDNFKIYIPYQEYCENFTNFNGN